MNSGAYERKLEIFKPQSNLFCAKDTCNERFMLVDRKTETLRGFEGNAAVETFFNARRAERLVDEIVLVNPSDQVS